MQQSAEGPPGNNMGGGDEKEEALSWTRWAEMNKDETAFILGILVVMGAIVYIYVGYRDYFM